MPIDLFFKIFGSITIPKILIEYPMLRFVLLKCFPKSMLDEIGFEESKNNLLSILKKLEKDFFVICFTKDGKCQLRQSIALSDSNAKILIYFNTPHSVELFWQFVEISNRLENIDIHSSDLWLKRWSIKGYFMNVNKDNSIIYSTIQKTGYKISRSIRQSELLVSKYGYDQILFADFIPLENSEESEEDIMIDNFCRDFKWENPKISSCLANLQISNDNSNNLDENYFLTDLVAKSKVTVGGIIHNSEIKWKKILLYLKNNESLDWKTISRKFTFLFSKFKSIQSRFDYTKALTIAQQYCHLGNQTDYYELSNSQILSHFNIINRQLIIKNEIGELVECFKRFFLCSLKNYTISQGKKLFSEYIWSYSVESLIFLKISGFYNPKDQIGFKAAKPKPHSQIEKRLFKNTYFYEKLKELFDLFQKSLNQPYNDLPINIYDSPSFYYIIHQDIFVNSMNYHVVDFLLNAKNSNAQALTSLFPSYSIQAKKVKNDLSIRFHSLPLPNLPNFQISYDSSLEQNDEIPKKTNSKKNSNLKIRNGLNNLLNATPEFFLIASQVKRFPNDGLSPFVRYTYGFIIHSEFDGLDLITLRNIFKLDLSSKLFDEFMLSLQFLEEFHFIKKKLSSSALPIYVSDAFFLRDEKEYYWTDIYHQIDEQLLMKQYFLVFEQIELNPGIEIFDLYIRISYLSVSNLLDIINVLIYDEAIYMITYISEGSLLEDTVHIPTCNFPSDIILVLFYIKQIDPNSHIPIIKLFPTPCSAVKNICLP